MNDSLTTGDPDFAELARLGVVCVAVAFALAPIATLLARRIYPGRNIFFARWGFSRVVLVVLVALLSSIFASALCAHWIPAPAEGATEGAPGALSTLVLGGQAVPTVMLAFFASLAMWLATGTAIVLLVKQVSPEGLGALGLRSDRLPAALLVALVGYVLLSPGIYGLGMIWRWVLEALGRSDGPQAVALELGLLDSIWFPLGAVFAILVIPFFEELAFRGFLQPLFVQNFGDKGGVVLTSAGFALLHGEVAFLPIFGLSLVLGSVMLRTQRLAAPILVHSLNNALMVLVLRHADTQELMMNVLLPG